MPRNRNPIPGLSTDAERVVNESTGSLDQRIAKLERKSGRGGVVIADTTAKVGEFLNIEAPAAGLTIIFPRPVAALRNERVTLSFRNANPVRLVCVEGQVNRAPFVINTAVGTFDCICDGQLGWATQTGLSSTGSPTNARYILGVAHGSLPNASVATDSPEIDVTATAGGTATWILRNTSIVLAKLQDLTGLSVLGRAANSTGVMAAITASAGRQVLRTNDAGTALVWGSPIEVQDDNVDQGDVHTLDFTSTTSIAATATVGSGEAVVSFQRQALSGAIAASANSNATVFAGIRDNGSAENDRTNLNFLSTTSNIATVTDDAGNDELEVTYQRAALTGDITAPQNSNTTTFRVANARTALVNATNGSAVPDYLQASTARHVLRDNGTNTGLEWGYPIGVFQDNEGSSVNGDFYRIVFEDTDGHIWTCTDLGSGSVEVKANIALSGAITNGGAGSATKFQGILDNGSAENDRTSLNFVSGTFINSVITDDAGNDELEIAHNLAPVAAGSSYGNQIDAGGTGIVALTGLEQGENLQIGSIVVDNTSSGDQFPYTGFTSPRNCLAFQNVTVNLRSMTARPNTMCWLRHTGTGTTTIQDEDSGAAAGEGFSTGCGAIVLRNDQQALFLHTNGSWRMYGVVVTTPTETEIQLSSLTGNMGTINIDAVPCGGSVCAGTTSASSAFSIEGFSRTIHVEGFWFHFRVESGLTNHCTLFNQDGTATSGNRMQLPADLDIANCGFLDGIFYYRDSRWRWIGGNPQQLAQNSLNKVEIVGGGVSQINIVTSGGDINVGAGGDLNLSGDVVRIDATNTNGVVSITSQAAAGGGSLQMTEQAASGATVAAGRGMFWVQNQAPSAPMYTDDTNIDREFATIGAPMTRGTAALFSIPFIIGFDHTTGAAGAAADDIIFNANAPFAFRIISSGCVTSFGIAASTVALRTATAGGGNLYVSHSTATAGNHALGMGPSTEITEIVPAGGTLVARWSDRGVRGYVWAMCVRT